MSHTHIEVGTTLVHDGDRVAAFRVTGETRLSWKVQEILGSGGLLDHVVSVNKATLVDRAADGRGYSRKPFVTLAAFERQRAEAKLRSIIIERLAFVALEVLVAIDNIILKGER